MTKHFCHDQVLSSKLCIFNFFQTNKIENKSISVVFRDEFDGDVHFDVAIPKFMKNNQKQKF